MKALLFWFRHARCRRQRKADLTYLRNLRKAGLRISLVNAADELEHSPAWRCRCTPSHMVTWLRAITCGA